MPNEPVPVAEDKEVALARITTAGFETKEKYHLFRLITKCILMAVGILIICATYLQATKPAWITAMGMILAVLGPSSIAAVSTYRIHFKEARRLRKRIAELEARTVANEETIHMRDAEIHLLKAQVNHLSAPEDGERYVAPLLEPPPSAS